MNNFLSENRHQELAAKLREMGMSQADIDYLTVIEDDLLEVDTAMAAHVMVAAQTRTDGLWEHARLAITILQAIMEEAMERGHAEQDFPLMLHAVRKDLREGFGIEPPTLQ